ncbi:MAG: hypothetical protein WC829_06925 [Hyphomicrobium sp.]|jgi:hypothetical protein
MSERRYTLGEITGAMGDAMKALQQRGGVFDGRLMRLFVDDAVMQLKDMPPKPGAAMLDNMIRELVSPND